MAFLREFLRSRGTSQSFEATHLKKKVITDTKNSCIAATTDPNNCAGLEIPIKYVEQTSASGLTNILFE